MKKKMILLSVILLLLFLLCYPAEALAAARNGLKLWLETLLPTLLPFMILTGILVHTDWITKILQPTAPFFKVVFGLSPGGAYVFLLGLLTGYPMGAKLTADLYYAGKISRQEAEYLLTFCNNPSPAFLITYVGHICLEGKLHIGFLVGILFLSDMICMCFFRFTVYRKNSLLSFCTPKTSEQEYTSAGLLDFVIMNSFETMAKLGGYILLGLIEVTAGLHGLLLSGFSYSLRVLLALCISAFGGFCIMAQTKSVLGKELSLHPYASAKCMNAAVTAVLILIFL